MSVIGLKVEGLKDWKTNLFSFWELNPNFKSHEPFKSIFESGRGKNGISATSTFMMGVALYSDNTSHLYQMIFNERLSLIVTDVFGGNAPDVKRFEDVCKAYRQFVMTTLERQHDVLKRKIEERIVFYEETTYSIQTINTLDKSMLNDTALAEQLTKLEKLIAQESSQEVVYGGGELSAAERGLI